MGTDNKRDGEALNQGRKVDTVNQPVVENQQERPAVQRRDAKSVKLPDGTTRREVQYVKGNEWEVMWAMLQTINSNLVELIHIGEDLRRVFAPHLSAQKAQKATEQATAQAPTPSEPHTPNQ